MSENPLEIDTSGMTEDQIKTFEEIRRAKRAQSPSRSKRSVEAARTPLDFLTRNRRGKDSNVPNPGL